MTTFVGGCSTRGKHTEDLAYRCVDRVGTCSRTSEILVRVQATAMERIGRHRGQLRGVSKASVRVDFHVPNAEGSGE